MYVRLTAGFRPSLSKVFRLRGPSIVGTVAELPTVQVQGLVGLKGDEGVSYTAPEP